MTGKCKKIVEKYLSTLNNLFEVEETEYGCTILTPFLRYNLENHRFHVKELTGGIIRISDLGNTVRQLETINVNFDNMRIKEIVSHVQKIFGVGFSEKSIVKDTKIDSLGNDLLNYINALHMFSDLEYLSTSARTKSFSDQVHEYCNKYKLKHSFRMGINIKGFVYHLDIVDSKEKKLIQTNGVSTDETATMRNHTIIKTYPFVEIELAKIERYYRVIMYDDNINWDSGSMVLMENHSDDLIKWREKKKLEALLTD